MYRSLILSAAVLLCACRTPVEIDPYRQDFNPRYYEDWGCDELKNELSFVLGRLKRRGHDLKTRENKDLAMTATGFVLFPPALFAVEIVETAADQDFEKLVQHAQAIGSIARDKDCPGVPLIETMEESS